MSEQGKKFAAGALVMLAIMGVVVIGKGIEDNRCMREQDSLITWAYMHAEEHGFQRNWMYPANSPQVEYLYVAVEADTVLFVRETFSRWGYILGEHPWSFWHSYQSPELQQQALARIREARGE